MPHLVGRGADRLDGEATAEKRMGWVCYFDLGNIFYQWVVEGDIKLTGNFDGGTFFYRWVVEGGINLYGRSIR